MSIFETEKGNAIYRVFKKDGTHQIHLGPVGKEDSAKVMEALAYVQQLRSQSDTRFDDLETQLLGYLPKEERRRLQTREASPTADEEMKKDISAITAKLNDEVTRETSRTKKLVAGSKRKP